MADSASTRDTIREGSDAQRQHAPADVAPELHDTTDDPVDVAPEPHGTTDDPADVAPEPHGTTDDPADETAAGSR